MDKILKRSKDIRIFLNNYFYNEDIMNNFIEYIEASIDTLSVEYNNDSRSIIIKIRKSTAKKLSKDSHSYRDSFDSLFTNFLEMNKDDIINMIGTYNPMLMEYMFDPRILPLIYNVTAINENTLIVYL